jgi:hypothetical protein
VGSLPKGKWQSAEFFERIGWRSLDNCRRHSVHATVQQTHTESIEPQDE